ncbi:MAG: cupin domain-containing protein [Candidatus Diapherotrites archaeon]|nr:cupin domain-containing protein [Candidatus Diapherotrites archaeon]
MQIKNVQKSNYFTAIDGCQITELFGLKTNSLKETSLAYAIVKPRQKTAEHTHNFLEIYVVVKGNGVMHLNGKSSEIKSGESVLIDKQNKHFIENSGKENLEFYCICVPAFSEHESEVKK